MNNLLSTVSGYFSRSLILGAFLPTVIFAFVFVIFVYPFLPADLAFFNQLNQLSPEWRLISITFLTVVLSGLLFNLNNSIIRVYEGYPWKNTWLGKWLIEQQVKKYRMINNQQKGMRTLLRAMRDLKKNLPKKKFSALQKETLRQIDQYIANAPSALRNSVKYKIKKNEVNNFEDKWDFYYSKINSNWNALNRQQIMNFPEKESLILPTKLGNAIRSFEYYPKREYGIDSIVMYPRLIAKIDKDYAAVIDDTKTSFDFMLNSSLLSTVLLVTVIIVTLAFGTPFKNITSIITLIIQIILLSVTAYFSYFGAINGAIAWGEAVKSAFDLYRNALLKQLGVNNLPENKLEERDLWNKISQQMLYGDYIGKPRLEYNELSISSENKLLTTSTSAIPANVELTILKSFNFLSERRTYQVILELTNTDKNQTDAKNVVISDIVPSEWFYQVGSANMLAGENLSKNKPVTVTGINPYYFHIGDLKHKQQKTVTYEILSFVKNK